MAVGTIFSGKKPDSGNRFFRIRNSGSGMAFLNSLFEGEQKLLVSFFDFFWIFRFSFFFTKKTFEARLCGLTSTQKNFLTASKTYALVRGYFYLISNLASQPLITTFPTSHPQKLLFDLEAIEAEDMWWL